MNAHTLEEKVALLRKSLAQIIPRSLLGMFVPILWAVMPPISLLYIVRRHMLLRVDYSGMQLSPETTEGFRFIEQSAWRAWFPITMALTGVLVVVLAYRLA